MWKELLGETIENIVILVSSDDGTTQVLQRNPVNHVVGLKECIETYALSEEFVDWWDTEGFSSDHLDE